MNIDLLASSIIYKDLFDEIPVICEAYEEYLNHKIKQEPFKTLIKRNVSPKTTLLYNNILSNEYKTYTNEFPDFEDSIMSFFVGIRKIDKLYWLLYYDVYNCRILYVYPKVNKEFLKLFVQTNENIFDNILLKNKKFYNLTDWGLDEMYVINYNEFFKLKKKGLLIEK